MKHLFWIFIFTLSLAQAQETFPVNGSSLKGHKHMVFINANIQSNPNEFVQNGTLEVLEGKVVKVYSGKKTPKGAVVVDCQGAYIYPSFIDLNSHFGIERKKSTAPSPGPQLNSKKSGAFHWNEAIKPETKAQDHYKYNPNQAKNYLSAGFGTVLSSCSDGIMRGSSFLTCLGENEQKNLIAGVEGNHLSFSKGSSRQSYPSSLMGVIALIRQSYYDAIWYEKTTNREENNWSYEAMVANKSLPQFFDAGNYLNVLRAEQIAKEFNLKYTYVTNGDSYKRINSLAEYKPQLIVPLNFPKAIDPTDPYLNLLITLEELREWEMAPHNPHILAENNIPFCLSMSGNKNANEFLTNLRKAVRLGLTEQDALQALTTNPASFIGAQEKIGTLENNKLANFIICSSSIFDKKCKIYQNWILGEQHLISKPDPVDPRGSYDLKIDGQSYSLTVEGKKGSHKAYIKIDTTKYPAKVKLDSRSVAVSIDFKDTLNPGLVQLGGYVHSYNSMWQGNGTLADGSWIKWTAIRATKDIIDNKKEENIDSTLLQFGNVRFPDMAYGLDSLPKKRAVLIKNVTVWTNEEDGILENTSVLVRDGKIAKIGKIVDVSDKDAIVIDGSGKHLTCGIIDEHSHIAIQGGVNESGQAIAAEVRIGDVIQPDDVNIYRQLAGGVTTSQLLHGSADPIGGQSAIIKLRWGQDAEGLKYENAPNFIKFALGENVKQSNWGDYNVVRFPQTRMGVEQVYYDGFYRALEYDEAWKNYNTKPKRNEAPKVAPRKDLELEALLQILRGERFITCHSYVQSEINMLMHVADSMGFTLNTFTHILEGYKLADKMKAHGAGASTFSDWWAYKYEVKDAIPYNAAILNQMGIITAINSDDAEMGRRLNQEAAKAVKYGGVSPEDAWKMVSLNPAKLLHIDDRVGSIKVGKDADLVLWSDNPLSVYSQVEYTLVDGLIYYDKKSDEQRRKSNALERARLLKKMAESIQAGEKPRPLTPTKKRMYNCSKEEEKQ